MWFWWFIFACDLLIPIMMLGFGKIMHKRAPKNINYIFGYRTTRSMKNEDTWRFAHEHCGRLWWKIGLIMLIPTVLVHIPFYNSSEDTLGIVAAIVMTIQIIVLIASIFPTEIALKKAFNDDGTVKRQLIELTDKNEMRKTYKIYKHCMFMPTEEKFNNKINKFLSDKSIKFFACLQQDVIKGVISVSFTEQEKAEILGIAVDTSVRSKGIGSYMINQLVSDYGLTFVLALTDDDAVEFYKKCGFKITKFTKTHHDGETVVHYRCELTK